MNSTAGETLPSLNTQGKNSFTAKKAIEHTYESLYDLGALSHVRLGSGFIWH